MTPAAPQEPSPQAQGPATNGANPTGQPSAQVRWLSALVLIALAAWSLLADLGASSFHDSDEALYASIARTMGESGDWGTPMYWDEPFLNKPPLMYWSMAFAQKVAPGPFEFRSRLPAALFSAWLLAMVFWWGRRLGGWWVAWGATALLLTNHQWLFEHGARSANLDAPLTALMFAALGWGAYAGQSRRCLWGSALAVGLIPMVKAPMLVFLLPVLVFLGCTDRSAAWRWLGACGLCVALLAVPWHAYAWITHGREFWDTYVGYEILGRVNATYKDPDTHWAIHLESLARGFWPWSPLGLLALAGACCAWPQPADRRQRAMGRLLAGYVLWIGVFFLFIPAKWPWYSLPAIPALAVLGATWVRALLAHRRGRWGLACLVTTFLAGLFLSSWNPEYHPVARGSWHWPLRSVFHVGGLHLPSPVELLWLVAVALGAAGLVWRKGWSDGSGIAIGGLLCFGIGSLAFFGLSRVPRTHSQPIAQFMEVLQAEGVQRIYTYGFPIDPNYGVRQAPLTSVYFQSLPGVSVTDCRNQLDRVHWEEARPAALAIYSKALQPRLRAELQQRKRRAAPDLDIWIVDPHVDSGFLLLQEH